MSSDDNHKQAHRHVTFAHVAFSPILVLILALTNLFCFTLLFIVEKCVFLSREELFDCGVATVLSKVTHM